MVINKAHVHYQVHHRTRTLRLLTKNIIREVWKRTNILIARRHYRKALRHRLFDAWFTYWRSNVMRYTAVILIIMQNEYIVLLGTFALFDRVKLLLKTNYLQFIGLFCWPFTTNGKSYGLHSR